MRYLQSIVKIISNIIIYIIERVEYEISPRYSEDDPEYACLVWIGERPKYIGIYH